ncbi:MAG: hypothetical protein ACK4ZJ_17115, partial [Allorhizobium sp.]
MRKHDIRTSEATHELVARLVREADEARASAQSKPRAGSGASAGEAAAAGGRDSARGSGRTDILAAVAGEVPLDALPRGKRTKARRARERYRDQDEEERLLRMAAVGNR